MLIDNTFTTNITFDRVTLEHIRTINYNYIYWYKEIALLNDGRIGVVMVNHNNGHIIELYYTSLNSFIKYINNKIKTM